MTTFIVCGEIIFFLKEQKKKRKANKGVNKKKMNKRKVEENE